MNEVDPARADEERVSTGIAGLDNILCGGLDPDRLYLVEGAGYGKDNPRTSIPSQWSKPGREGAVRYAFGSDASCASSRADTDGPFTGSESSN